MATQYKRGQVEWALWQSIDSTSSSGKGPPPVFNTRVKRLLELDRAALDDSPGFAFSDQPAGGQGVDVAFSAFDAFCLVLAVDLLDTGFKQSEIVFLFRYIRPQLKAQFDWMTSRTISLRQVVPAEDYPDLPSFQDGDLRLADFRVFALIQKVELKEAYSATPGSPNAKRPLILEPVFCRGIEALQAEINHRDCSFRKALVLELSTPAALITRNLDKAPVARRGRG